jgi:hypothetical protein
VWVQPCGFWKLGHADFLKNLLTVKAVKLMVKLKNLFRLKDGLGKCLEDANITEHLPLHGKI